MGRYAAAIFLGAFLLFQVQPIVAKYILPWFGGGVTIWTTCMLFFQVFLLGGYAYSHALTSRLQPRRQAVVHLLLLLLSLAFLPITPAGSWRPLDAAAPTSRILALLAVSVGVPFLLLASTGPLLQRWFSRQTPGVSPYRLYALSNAGSLLGLLAYPFLVERIVGLHAQTVLWSSAYAVFILAAGWCAVAFYRAAPLCDEPVRTTVGARAPSWTSRLFWLLLAACGSLLLLSTTQQITQDVAPVPFLWVLPLGLYLLSFIVCFDRDRWYDRRFWAPALFACLPAAVIADFDGFSGMLVQIVVYSVTLFVCGMVCHGELVRLRPDPRYLTSFYLIVALGGAAGGAFASLVAPSVLDDLWEFHIGLLATYALFTLRVFLDESTPLYRGRMPAVWAALIAGGLALGVALAVHVRSEQKNAIATIRNFYGVLGVYEYDRETPNWRRYLWHGQAKHGGQFVAPERRRQPTVYYGPESGMAVAIDHHPDRAAGLHIGAVGLGVGTVAAFGRADDTIRTYEINPEAIRIADEYFFFRQDGAAYEETVLGDARVSLERELAAGDVQHFDVLVLDAFNSDSIPMHLLTREAFELYRKHLELDGILAFHISSVYLDLSPVVRGLAQEAGIPAIRLTNERDPGEMISWSEWVLVTDNKAFLAAASVRDAVKAWPRRRPEKIVWTDDHSDLFSVLK